MISTGTPGGVGVAQGKFLVVGALMRVTIENVDTIENTFIDEPATTVLPR